MAEVDLDYDPASLCGPADERVIRELQDYTGHTLDPAYLVHARRWHGGVPGRAYFDAGDGKTYRVGRFLTLLDGRSPLEPPPRPSWEFPDRDARVDWSVLTLIDQEGPSCRCLFGGEALLPFAALYWGPDHSDEVSLTGGDADLVAFLYEGDARPRVVVWRARDAAAEYGRWEEATLAGGESDEEEPVRYGTFTAPVAPDFDAFLARLRPAP